MASVHSAQDFKKRNFTEIAGFFTPFSLASFLSGIIAGGVLLLFPGKADEKTSIKLAALGLLCVSAADLIYAALYSRPGHELHFLFKIGEMLYLGFMALLVAFVLSRYRILSHFSKLDWALLLVLVMVFATLNYIYILVPFYSRPETPDLINSILSAFYALTVSLLVPFLLVEGFAVNDLLHGLLFHILLLLNIVDFGIRYKTAFPAFQLPNWFENGWYVCLIAFSSLLLLFKNKIFSGMPKHVGLISLRGIYAASMLLAFIVYGIFLKSVGIYKFDDISLIVSILVATYPVWVMTNIVSLQVSKSISQSNSRLLGSMSGCFGRGYDARNCISGSAAHTRISEFKDLAESYNRMLNSANQLFLEKTEAEKAASLSFLAMQVAHDIRSPLAALGTATKGLALPAEKRTLIGGAVERIQNIADDLLNRYRAPGTAVNPKITPHELAVLINQLVSEKELQYKDNTEVKIIFSGAAGLKAVVEAKEFQRLISNLINNSVEALEKGGTVSVSLSSLDSKVLIKVQDDGEGITPEILAKLGQKGETHGKAGGTGLGLYHARTTVENWGGSLKIESEPGKGTSVTIELPEAGIAAGPAVLLDDDPLVRMNWKMAARAAGVNFTAYKTPEDFTTGIASLPKDTSLYIDSDLGDGIKGEDVAIELNNKGFTAITMATGQEPERFSHLPWLKVSGKEPPWDSA